MANELSELEDLLAIDEEQLQAEWKRQPTLYVHLARHAARASAAVAEMELAIRNLEAELSKKFRVEGVPGVARTTDEGVKAAIACDQKVKEFRNALITLREMETIKVALMKAAEMRERSLKWLSLHETQMRNIGAMEEA